MAWDAGWYQAIAHQGYAALGTQSVRFFPLWPLLARGLHGLGVPLAWALALGASALWFGALIAVDQLASTAGFAPRTSSASLWLLCLVPGAVATVLGYAEPLLVLLVATTLTCTLRVRKGGDRSALLWTTAIIASYLAALTRPVGVVLCVPLMFETWRHRRTRSVALGVMAALAPIAGLLTYLWWCSHRFGSWRLPLTVQTQAAHHGGLTNPVSGLLGDLNEGLQGHLSVLLHLPWVAVAVVLCVIAFKRAPASLALYSSAIVILALSGHNLDSFERYLLAAPPLFMVAGEALRSSRVRILVLILLGGLLMAWSILVFSNVIVP
jgi:hypothetical protein